MAWIDAGKSVPCARVLLDSLAAAEGANGDDEVADDREFILAELLRLALNLDYADEIGRRRLEQFVRTCGISFGC